MEYEALNRERQFKERALAYAGLAYRVKQMDPEGDTDDPENDTAE